MYPHRAKYGLVVLVILLIVKNGNAQAESKTCTSTLTAKTNFGIVVDFPRRIPSGTAITHIIPDVPVRYISVHVRILEAAPNDWKMTFYDKVGRPLVAYSAQSTGGSREFSTSRLPVSQLDLVVEAGEVGRDTVDILYYVAMPSNTVAHYYSIKGAKADWEDLHRSGEMRFRISRGEPVGMLIGSYGSNASGHYVWTCSGMIVSTFPKVLFATADHCGAPTDFKDLAWSQNIRDRMFVDLSWDGDTVSREYSVDSGSIFRDIPADLAVIPLKARDYAVPPRAVTLRDLKLDSTESVFIVHHPASEQKKISTNCAIRSITVGATATYTHDCDTAEGSSGAPIFSESGDVVGIHVGGFEADDSGKCDWRNKAIPSQALKRLLESANAPSIAPQ